MTTKRPAPAPAAASHAVRPKKTKKKGVPSKAASAKAARAAGEDLPSTSGGGGEGGVARPRPSSAAPDLDEADAIAATAGAALPVPAWADGLPDFRNRERVLILSTRGITHRFRHLMLDLFQLLPHAKKDSKLDTKAPRTAINDVADLKGCTSVLLFEARKRSDLYLWLARTPEGPSAKFLVHNVHTMAELKLAGNHLKGSRPVLSFHGAFDATPHWRLVKEMLAQAFATPRRHPRSKPFMDHVLSFSIADGKIWARNYQIVPPTTAPTVAPGDGAAVSAKVAAAGAKAARAAAAAAAGGNAGLPLGGGDLSLVEVGPRFCLEPIKLFAGSCGGRVLYDNADFVSPNAVRSALKKAAAGKYGKRVKAAEARKARRAAVPAVEDEMAGLFK